MLAEKGFDSSDEIIEGKKGFCRIYSDIATPEAVLDALGERWEIARNGHKPYACGVVLHPAIDAMIELGGTVPADAGAIESIAIRVNSHAVTITGLAEPKSGLQSKFSIYHSAAVAFLDALESSPRIQIIPVEENHENTALRWLRQHDEREYSFVDATSFALMRAHRLREAFAFDSDFAAAGFIELRA